MTQPDDATFDPPDLPSPRERETVPAVDSAAELADILDAYMALLHAGKSPDRGELLAAHPALAAQLEACLAGIEFIHRAAGPAADKPATLGDFQVVRELGRGGMGVVYEAEQTSLRRRVALKVLRFGAVADIEAMRRFRREAETVARLHHTNIVPIFAVGCERDVHYYAMQFISDSRLGRVLLSTDGPPLTAQVLSESGEEPIGEPFAVGTRNVVSLPEDTYRLRVEGPGIFGQTYQFGVGRGELGSYRLAADENRLLGNEPIPYAFASDALVLSPGKADLVEWTGQTLIRRDGASGKPVWDASRPVKPWDPTHDPIAWMRRLSYLANENRPGRLLQPAPDLDGDGTSDIVWAFRVTPSLLALSGKDGSLLWTYSAAVDGRGGPDLHGPAWPESIERVPRQGRVLGSPSPRDVDGDGIVDLIAAFVLFEDGPPVLRRPGPNKQSAAVESDEWAHRGKRVVAAVSGRSGRVLWTHLIDSRTTTIPKHTLDRGTSLIGDRADSTVAFVAGGEWIGLDPANGQPRGKPVDLGFVPVRPAQHADLDGDGKSEVLALGPGPAPNQQTLVAFSCGTGREIWSLTIRANYHSPLISPAPDWPLIVDLDGDGRSEVVVADSGPMAKGYDYRGVRLLDGASGTDRWVRPIHPRVPASASMAMFDDGLAQVIATPDLDADGTRDLVAVSRFDGRHFSYEPVTIYVDAISGKDGHSLWWWRADFKMSYRGASPLIWTPLLWGRGKDGWPMLAVPLGGTLGAKAGPLAPPFPHHEPPRAHLLSLASGRELHTIDGLSWPKPADLDGDGLEDLWGSVDGKLRAYRGETPEAWRLLGRYRKAGDLDGDGVADVVSDDLRVRLDFNEESRKTLTAVAHSGRDGRALWRKKVDYQGPWLEQYVEGEPGYKLAGFPLPGGDLDGDGAPEVSVIRSQGHDNSLTTAATLPLEVLSGRSGQPLWSVGPLPLGFEANGYSEIASIDLRACEPRGPIDLIVRHQGRFVQAGPGPRTMSFPQDHLARVSGRDGHVIWDRPLADQKGSKMAKVADLPHAFGDFDGDGGLDIVVLIQVDGVAGPCFERRAVALRDGKTLWSHMDSHDAGPLPALAAGDLDGDGRPELVVRDHGSESAQAQFAVTALDGRDGSTRWTWRGGGFSGAIQQNPRDVCLADLEGNGVSDVCVNVRVSDQHQRVVILDAMGKERASRELKAVSATTLTCADLNGDGRDELLFVDGGQVRAVRHDLTDLWSRPTREPVREVIPGRQGQPAVVVLESLVGLDGATGRPLWAGRRSTGVLDPGDSKRPPRLHSDSGDTTICRLALAMTPQGAFQPALGAPIAHQLASEDPRWMCPLPWNGTNGIQWVWAIFLFAGIAFVNIVIPLVILKLATRRRRWGVSLLLALPAAVAIPMAVFAFAPPMQVVAQSAAGLPVLEYVMTIGRNLRNRHWRRLAVRFGLTALASVVIGILYVCYDMRETAAIEHYNWSKRCNLG